MFTRQKHPDLPTFTREMTFSSFVSPPVSPYGKYSVKTEQDWVIPLRHFPLPIWDRLVLKFWSDCSCGDSKTTALSKSDLRPVSGILSLHFSFGVKKKIATWKSHHLSSLARLFYLTCEWLSLTFGLKNSSSDSPWGWMLEQHHGHSLGRTERRDWSLALADMTTGGCKLETSHASENRPAELCTLPPFFHRLGHLPSSQKPKPLSFNLCIRVCHLVLLSA